MKKVFKNTDFQAVILETLLWSFSILLGIWVMEFFRAILPGISQVTILDEGIGVIVGKQFFNFLTGRVIEEKKFNLLIKNLNVENVCVEIMRRRKRWGEEFRVQVPMYEGNILNLPSQPILRCITWWGLSWFKLKKIDECKIIFRSMRTFRFYFRVVIPLRLPLEYETVVIDWKKLKSSEDYVVGKFDVIEDCEQLLIHRRQGINLKKNNRQG